MSKQVALSDEAYAVLKSRKRPGESFSQTVMRLAEGSKDAWAFVGRHAASDLSVEERMRLSRAMRQESM